MVLGLSPLPLSLMIITSSCLMRSKYLTPSRDQVLMYRSDRWVWRKWGGPKQLEDKKTRSLMMLPYVPSSIPRQYWLKTFLRTDYVLTQDKSFKKYAKAYADNADLFFHECVSRLSAHSDVNSFIFF